MEKIDLRYLILPIIFSIPFYQGTAIFYFLAYQSQKVKLSDRDSRCYEVWTGSYSQLALWFVILFTVQFPDTHGTVGILWIYSVPPPSLSNCQVGSNLYIKLFVLICNINQSSFEMIDF